MISNINSYEVFRCVLYPIFWLYRIISSKFNCFTKDKTSILSVENFNSSNNRILQNKHNLRKKKFLPIKQNSNLVLHPQKPLVSPKSSRKTSAKSNINGSNASAKRLGEFPNVLIQRKWKPDGLVLGGSTGVRSGYIDGKHYVKKRGSHTNHLLAEYQANQVYQVLGIPASTSRLYDSISGELIENVHPKPKNPVMLSRFLENAKPLSEYMKGASKEDIEKMRVKIQSGFIADALLANWDVIGICENNVLISEDGTPIRIDNGSSFEYRSNGDRKAIFGDAVNEVFTLLDDKINPAAKFFAGISDREIIRQIDQLQSKFEDVLKVVDPKYHAILRRRKDWLVKYKDNLSQNSL